MFYWDGTVEFEVIVNSLLNNYLQTETLEGQKLYMASRYAQDKTGFSPPYPAPKNNKYIYIKSHFLFTT